MSQQGEKKKVFQVSLLVWSDSVTPCRDEQRQEPRGPCLLKTTFSIWTALLYPATAGCFTSANEGDIPDLSLFMKVTSSISLFKSVPFRESKPSQAVHPHDYRLAPWPPMGLQTQLPAASLARRCYHYGRQALHKCWEGRADTLPCSCHLWATQFTNPSLRIKRLNTEAFWVEGQTGHWRCQADSWMPPNQSPQPWERKSHVFCPRQSYQPLQC